MFDLLVIVFSIAVVLVAYFVRGVAGFGSALIAVPLLLLEFPLQAVVPLVVLMDFLGSLSQGANNRQHIAWRELFVLLPFTVIGVVSGLFIAQLVDARILLQILGGFIIVLAIYQLLPLATSRGSQVFAVPCGFFGGIVGTLFATGGPFYATYYLMRGLEKEKFRSSFATYFTFDGGIRIVGYLIVGFYARDEFINLLWLLPVAAIGLYLGGRAQLAISKLVYKRLISSLLILSGSMLLIR